MSSKSAVFLDRDGVVNVPIMGNGRSYAPKNFDEFVLYSDAVDSVQKLSAAGFLIVLVTNQPDVGKGLTAISEVERMHAYLLDIIQIDNIQVCYDTRDMVNNRLKPSPAMLLDAAEELKIKVSESFMVGDRAGDIEAGVAAGCGHNIFIDRGYTAEKPPEKQSVTVSGLSEAADWILSNQLN